MDVPASVTERGINGLKGARNSPVGSIGFGGVAERDDEMDHTGSKEWEHGGSGSFAFCLCEHR